MLWMTRTPLRVSLFGGGTDYPEYFHRRPGAVIGFAINQYIHIAALRLNPFLGYNYRIAYSKLENCERIDQIQHPVVREVLRHLEISERLDISVMSDLPASGSGLGSSSAFTVGFLKLAYSILNRPVTKIDLARSAIHVERDLLKENVGVQDQLHTAFGGINKFEFDGDRIRVTPLQISSHTFSVLRRSMALVHTGIGRRATDAAAAQVAEIRSKNIDSDLDDLLQLVGECVDVLESRRDDFLVDMGRMLTESWLIKRRLTASITNESIDRIYAAIMSSGAYGAKLCGAGGGGFFIALVPPEKRHELQSAVAPLSVAPIDIDVDGTSLIYPAQSNAVA
jgi:D-glycero-alpha-D-manno-heptose-7-phosphate kinase